MKKVQKKYSKMKSSIKNLVVLVGFLAVLWSIISLFLACLDYFYIKPDLVELNKKEKKEEVFSSSDLSSSLPKDNEIKIRYNLPLERGLLSEIRAQNECEKNNTCLPRFDAIRTGKNGNLKTELHCVVQNRSFLFLRLFFTNMFRKNKNFVKYVEYTCKLEQRFDDTSIALKATFRGETPKRKIEEIAHNWMAREYSSVQDILMDFMDHIEFTSDSVSYYQFNKCKKGSLGYERLENRCIQDRYSFVDGKELRKAFYPDGILKNEQETSKGSWISKIYNEQGNLKEKITEKGNSRIEEYYSYGKLKQINRSNRDLDDLRYVMELYSASGDLKYEIKRKGEKVEKAYEYINGHKKEMTKVQIYNTFKLESEE